MDTPMEKQIFSANHMVCKAVEMGPDHNQVIKAVCKLANISKAHFHKTKIGPYGRSFLYWTTVEIQSDDIFMILTDKPDIPENERVVIINKDLFLKLYS